MMNQRTSVQRQAKTAPTVQGAVLQRQCACGQHTGGGAECEECQEKKKKIQRSAMAPPATTIAPPIVHEALRSSGQPLDPPVRAFMESRFARYLDQAPRRISAPVAASALEIGSREGSEEREAEIAAARVMTGSSRRMPSPSGRPASDFSRVRVHTGGLAARSAEAVSARAYTVGRDIVFAGGQYHPGSAAGRHLLAHELTHVVQQGEESPRKVQRLGFFENIGVALGFVEGDFSEPELLDYLNGLQMEQTIDGSYDADNKARVAIRKIKAGTLKVALSSIQKKFLILEMQDGVVTDGDREGILGVLEMSGPRDLLEMFGPGGVSVESLRKDLKPNPYGEMLAKFLKERMASSEGVAEAGPLEPRGDVEFTDQELDDYVRDIFARQAISGVHGADKKAATVVRKWRSGELKYDLWPLTKRLLVQEMLSGNVTDDDREWVLVILESAGLRDLQEIFGSAGVTAAQLDGSMVGEPYKTRLNAFYDLRFKGGAEAVRAKKIEPLPGIELGKMDAAARKRFIDTHFAPADRAFASKILEDLAQVKDVLDFANEEELVREVFKRLRTSRLMQETQSLFGRAFEYPNKAEAKACLPLNKGKPPEQQMENPRVNEEAKAYWGAVQYGSPIPGFAPSYFFELAPDGKKNAYDALVKLFKPQPSICRMTLIHCDYLASVVHLRTFAESIGVQEFNDRVEKGLIDMKLTFYGFAYLEPSLARSRKAFSLQEFRPSSEEDLVIGDHVIFWNHRAYDLINERIGNAWRLENAILTEKARGVDQFLGHGSGKRDNTSMRKKLAEEYNDVVRKAEPVIQRTRSANPKTAQAAKDEMGQRFPRIQEKGGEWRIVGNAHKKDFDEPLKRVKDTDPGLIGLRDPDDPSKMNLVKRPIESY